MNCISQLITIGKKKRYEEDVRQLIIALLLSALALLNAPWIVLIPVAIVWLGVAVRAMRRQTLDHEAKAIFQNCVREDAILSEDQKRALYERADKAPLAYGDAVSLLMEARTEAMNRSASH